MSRDDVNVHPFQALVDGMALAAQRARAEAQMTLGKLIATLEALPPDRRVTGFGRPHSYRGYYHDLSFAPSGEVQTVADLLRTCKEGCMGQVFEGYKGGEFMMGALTPVWVSPWGRSSGEKLMGLDAESDPIRPVTAVEERW